MNCHCEWRSTFSASKKERHTQAVTTLMGDAKVELGDEVAISHSTPALNWWPLYPPYLFMLT